MVAATPQTVSAPQAAPSNRVSLWSRLNLRFSTRDSILVLSLLVIGLVLAFTPAGVLV